MFDQQTAPSIPSPYPVPLELIDHGPASCVTRGFPNAPIFEMGFPPFNTTFWFF